MCLYLSITHITWSEGGGFIPAMADILWSRPGASAKKEISSSTILSQVPWNINQCITIFFERNNQAVQKYSLLIHFVISDCSQEMLITMPAQALAMIAMLWLLKIRKKFFALHVVTAGPEHLAVDCLDFPKSSLDPHCPVRIPYYTVQRHIVQCGSSLAGFSALSSRHPSLKTSAITFAENWRWWGNHYLQER